MRLKIAFFALVVSLPFSHPAIIAQEALTHWWNDRVFYQIFVRSFYDSDGDGIGDLRGIIEKLDYLNDGDPNTTTDLGITGIWLMPIMPSPSYHGYDVTDYYGIHPDYGTKKDFQELIDAAHARGIAVIIDLVLNHTSSQHPWFIESQQPDSEYADWYVWSETNPGYKGPENQNVWHSRSGRYYYGLFWSGMPDLNYHNPDVTTQMYDVSRFWLQDMNVDGFRLDAVKYFVDEDRAQENTQSNHQWLQNYSEYVHSVKPDAMLVGEIWATTNLVSAYVDDEVDLAFEFDLAQAMVRSANFGLPNTFANVFEPVLATYPTGQFATFLANHDQDRFMSQARGNLNAARLGASLYLTLPGVPFIYYGEEIGMSGKRTKSDTDAERRTPMQWDDTTSSGFTTGEPWYPVNEDYTQVNVNIQTDDETSLLSLYRDLIQVRNISPALRSGDFTFVTSVSRKVLSFLRHHENQTVLVIINMDDRPVTDYALSLESSALTSVSSVEWLLGDGLLTAPTLNASGGFETYIPLPELAAFTPYIIQFDS